MSRHMVIACFTSYICCVGVALLHCIYVQHPGGFSYSVGGVVAPPTSSFTTHFLVFLVIFGHILVFSVIEMIIFRLSYPSVPELINLGGKQHPYGYCLSTLSL